MTNRLGIHRAKIEPIDEGRAKVYVDGMEVRANKVDVHMEVGCVHQTDIRVIGEPDLDYESLVTFDFDPKTIVRAVNVIKIALERKDITAELGMNDLMRVMGR